jgi:hypothetical protein
MQAITQGLQAGQSIRQAPLLEALQKQRLAQAQFQQQQQQALAPLQQQLLQSQIEGAQSTQAAPVKLGQGDILVDPITGKQVAQGLAKAVGKTQPRVDKLRSRFDTFSKDLVKVDASARKVDTASDNAQGDMSLIFGFMKLLDPGSTVREGEFATAEAADGIPARILNFRDRLLEGTRLNPEQRQAFKDEAKKLVKAQQDSFDNQTALILQQADQDQVSREKVIGVKRLREFEKRAADRLIKTAPPPASEFDPALVEFMTPEERVLFDGS